MVAFQYKCNHKRIESGTKKYEYYEKNIKIDSFSKTCMEKSSSKKTKPTSAHRHSLFDTIQIDTR